MTGQENEKVMDACNGDKLKGRENGGKVCVYRARYPFPSGGKSDDRVASIDYQKKGTNKYPVQIPISNWNGKWMEASSLPVDGGKRSNGRLYRFFGRELFPQSHPLP